MKIGESVFWAGVALAAGSMLWMLMDAGVSASNACEAQGGVPRGGLCFKKEALLELKP